MNASLGISSLILAIMLAFTGLGAPNASISQTLTVENDGYGIVIDAAVDNNAPFNFDLGVAPVGYPNQRLGLAFKDYELSYTDGQNTYSLLSRMPLGFEYGLTPEAILGYVGAESGGLRDDLAGFTSYASDRLRNIFPIYSAQNGRQTVYTMDTTIIELEQSLILYLMFLGSDAELDALLKTAYAHIVAFNTTPTARYADKYLAADAPPLLSWPETAQWLSDLCNRMINTMDRNDMTVKLRLVQDAGRFESFSFELEADEDSKFTLNIDTAGASFLLTSDGDKLAEFTVNFGNGYPNAVYRKWDEYGDGNQTVRVALLRGADGTPDFDLSFSENGRTPGSIWLKKRGSRYIGDMFTPDSYRSYHAVLEFTGASFALNVSCVNNMLKPVFDLTANGSYELSKGALLSGSFELKSEYNDIPSASGDLLIDVQLDKLELSGALKTASDSYYGRLLCKDGAIELSATSTGGFALNGSGNYAVSGDNLTLQLSGAASDNTANPLFNFAFETECARADVHASLEYTWPYASGNSGESEADDHSFKITFDRKVAYGGAALGPVAQYVPGAATDYPTDVVSDVVISDAVLADIAASGGAIPGGSSDEMPEDTEDITVWFSPTGIYYHAEAEPACGGTSDGTAHTLSEAQAADKVPCPICFAEK